MSWNTQGSPYQGGLLHVPTAIHVNEKLTCDYLSLERNYFLHISVFSPSPLPSASLPCLISLAHPAASS